MSTSLLDKETLNFSPISHIFNYTNHEMKIEPMNTDENNPNTFSSDDDLNFIQMTYSVRSVSLSEVEEAPPKNYIRPIIAIIMVMLLILSVSYTTLQSLLLEQNDSSIASKGSSSDFDVVLTGISTTTTNCQNAPRVTLSGTYVPTAHLCICGSLYTDETTVNYVLRLRTVGGSLLEQTDIRNQSEGAFCQHWKLSDVLEEGRYRVELASTRNSQPIQTMWLTVADQPF